MFINEWLKRFRKQSATNPHPLPGLATVDIELPLDPPAQPASIAPQQHWERVLSPDAHVWLTQLPPSVRPTHLADSFPRIANRITLCWCDFDLTDKVLDELLVDRRTGRQGFPTEVSTELLRLHSFHERRRTPPQEADEAVPARAWDLHLQASADR